jgi:hypothetical protein
MFTFFKEKKIDVIKEQLINYFNKPINYMP